MGFSARLQRFLLGHLWSIVCPIYFILYKVFLSYILLPVIPYFVGGYFGTLILINLIDIKNIRITNFNGMRCHILIQIHILVILDTCMCRIMCNLRMYKMFPSKVDQCLE